MEEKEFVLKTCLRAGKIMIESGSEVYRVEDTMNRIAANAGYPDSDSYVTATGIFMGLGEEPATQFLSIKKRVIDLEKVALVNQLSRSFQNKELTIEEFYKSLKELDKYKTQYSNLIQYIAAGVVSCTLVYMFNFGMENVLPGFVVGFLAYVVHKWVGQVFDTPFLSDFIGSFVIGILSIFFVQLHFGNSVDGIIIGAVMPLVPGVAITNAFRDILQGHLISGTARGTEAIFTAGAIGIGIAMSLKLFL